MSCGRVLSDVEAKWPLIYNTSMDDPRPLLSLSPLKGSSLFMFPPVSLATHVQSQLPSLGLLFCNTFPLDSPLLHRDAKASIRPLTPSRPTVLFRRAFSCGESILRYKSISDCNGPLDKADKAVEAYR